jgi:hypothetical protein
VKDWCRPGQRVVCLRDDWESVNVNRPSRCQIYTIRTVEINDRCTCLPADTVMLRFEEIVNSELFCYLCNSPGEPQFVSTAFRPVRDTSIEDLRTLLNPTPDQVYGELRDDAGRVHRELVGDDA